MNTKIIFGIVVVLILIIGGSIIKNRNFQEAFEENPTERSVQNENVEIESEKMADNTTVKEEGEELQPIIAPPMNIEVIYTDKGFEPKEITVRKGQTVTWINNSNRSMWVASNIHPTHTIYPLKSENDCLGSSFDACAVQQQGESYSFTFNELGNWQYHNHVQANKTGTVVVK